MENDLTLEKLRIVEQLLKITETLVIQGEQLKHLVEGQVVTHKALLGDGSTMNPGLIIDVDRLKQTAEDDRFHRKAVYTGLIGIILEHFRHLFFSGK